MFRDMTGSKDSLGIGKVVLILISKSCVVNEVPGRRKHSQRHKESHFDFKIFLRKDVVIAYYISLEYLVFVEQRYKN